MSSLIRTVTTTAQPSERLLRACATFGLAVDHCESADAHRPTFTLEARSLRLLFKPGDIVLIQGASGSGKSTLLGELTRLARVNGHTVIGADAAASDPQAALIDLIDLPLPEALRTLAHAGLADATMLSRTAYQLSEGERFRLRLAQSLAAAQGSGTSVTLAIDEFASVLDRTTARCLCYALRRLLGSLDAPPVILLATAHDDVRAWLTPTHTIECAHGVIERTTP